MEPWVIITLAAIIMWGAQGIARALRGVPDPRRVQRGRAVGGLLRDAAADEAVRTELEDLRQRMSELEGLHHRVAELEERQDFTERVLTRGSHDTEPGGRHGS